MGETVAGQGALPCCVDSGLRIRIRIICGVAGSGDPGGANMTRKKRKKVSKFYVLCIAGCSLLRDEGFSCSLGVLYRGLGISKLQFLIKKILNFFQL
jgi:hypothetical protein